jgi:hypothetical protein
MRRPGDLDSKFAKEMVREMAALVWKAAFDDHQVVRRRNGQLWASRFPNAGSKVGNVGQLPTSTIVSEPTSAALMVIALILGGFGFVIGRLCRCQSAELAQPHGGRFPLDRRERLSGKQCANINRHRHAAELWIKKFRHRRVVARDSANPPKSRFMQKFERSFE